ncbi:MAG: hypothetical protein ACJ8FS_15460 [Sphingomicrobium sp.]
MRRIALPCLALASIAVVQPAVAASTFWTANDPFVGKWRLDISRSTIVDDMRVQVLGPNRYGFNFEGAPTEIIIADGTDQPGLPGTTLAVKAADARTLTVVRKQDGRIIILASWSLSEDGRTLRDAFTSVQPDGSSATVDYVYKRLSGSSGFAGTWESTTKPTGLKVELGIQPYGSKGLSFVSVGSNRSVTFDGQEHAVPGDKDGLTFSGRRKGARAMQYTEKKRDEVQRARQFELSRDGRTLTETLHTSGHVTPDVFVFERE